MNSKILRFNLENYGTEGGVLIERALDFATKAHEGQSRKSGWPYITHPTAVAQSLIELDMDAQTIAAALLHDTIEDTSVTIQDLQAIFGTEIAGLVEGVTKTGQVDHMPSEATARTAASAENIRKLLLAMTKDIRVIIIKLADRTHNLSTLQYLSPEKQQRIARESLEIYAPLADRLGMGALKVQIEDLSFAYLYPGAYGELSKLMASYGRSSQKYLSMLKKQIAGNLSKAGLEVVSIDGRTKHLYSIWRKLQKADGDIEKIYDLIAIRIIVPTESDCYQALGILHQHFKPLIYRIKDYIAVPKPNGYRSLHTTVFAAEGRITEIQIRTPQMHSEAEKGLAAHFYYNSVKGSSNYKKANVSAVPSKLGWVNELVDVGQVTGSGQDFVDALKVDLFVDRIFVFSPKGDLYDLPEGATPIDFAFMVHSGLGLKVAGAKVNGRIASLDAPLANRDVVEILTRKNIEPKRAWLTSVKTANARSRIRAWFRKQSYEENFVSGRGLIETELKAWGHAPSAVSDELWQQAADSLGFKNPGLMQAAVGEGSISAHVVVRRLFPVEDTKPTASVVPESGPRPKPGLLTVQIAGTHNLPYQLSPCCHPSYPQPIIGYITRGKGITVHSKSCPNLPDDKPRLVSCRWQAASDYHQPHNIRIIAQNRLGLLRDVTALVTTEKYNITAIHSYDNEEGTESTIELTVEVPNRDRLVVLMRKLGHIQDVGTVQIK